MPETGVWATDSIESSKFSYYEDITEGWLWSLVCIPIMGSSDSQS
jgi:hypothetical protein